MIRLWAMIRHGGNDQTMDNDQTMGNDQTRGQ